MSDSHGLTADNFYEALPEILKRDKSTNALAKGTASVLETRAAEIKAILLYPLIDQLPEELLDILAHDFKVDWYNADYPLQAKRNTIKTHWYVHRRLGTIGAVRVAIQAIYPRSSVEEWWQDWYNGDPYHFRIILEAATPIVPVANTDILNAIQIYKSLRSVLDYISYRTTVTVGIKIVCGWVAYSGRLAGTHPQRARQGQIYESAIEVSTHAEGLLYSDPAAGEINAGVFPATAEQGSIESGIIGASASGEGLTYSTRYCGAVPGSLI